MTMKMMTTMTTTTTTTTDKNKDRNDNSRNNDTSPPPTLAPSAHTHHHPHRQVRTPTCVPGLIQAVSRARLGRTAAVASSTAPQRIEIVGVSALVDVATSSTVSPETRSFDCPFFIQTWNLDAAHRRSNSGEKKLIRSNASEVIGIDIGITRPYDTPQICILFFLSSVSQYSLGYRDGLLFPWRLSNITIVRGLREMRPGPWPPPLLPSKRDRHSRRVFLVCTKKKKLEMSVYCFRQHYNVMPCLSRNTNRKGSLLKPFRRWGYPQV